MCIGAGLDADVPFVNSEKLDFNILLAQLSGKLGQSPALRVPPWIRDGARATPADYSRWGPLEQVNQLGSGGALREYDFHHSLDACSVQFHD